MLRLINDTEAELKVNITSKLAYKKPFNVKVYATLYGDATSLIEPSQQLGSFGTQILLFELPLPMAEPFSYKFTLDKLVSKFANLD